MTKVSTAKYPNARLEALHLTAQSLARVDGLDKKTLRAIESFCLTEVRPMTGAEIQALREREGISQAVLAQHLNVGTKLVSDWERGEKKPSGPSLKLLTLVKVKGLASVA